MMDFKNRTLVTEFILLGFSESLKINTALFALFFGVYLVAVNGNVLILCTILINAKLHTPMYFFISILSILDVFITTTVVPKLLSDLISLQKVISFAACTLQCFIILLLPGSESFLLALMGYDRYLAICRPLHYPVLMRWSVCYQLTAFVWIISFIIFLLPSILMSPVLCNPNLVNHFLCEPLSIIQLACDRVDSNKILMVITCFFALLLPFMFVLVSYICIISTVLKMRSAGRSKAFSTCTSHITVVVLAYGAGLLMYFGPSSQYTAHHGKYLSLFSYVICPTINPIIYGLNNKDVKNTCRRFLIFNILK